jgi:two-component system OmpR family response regulator
MKKRRLLVIDDEPDFMQVDRTVAEEMGFAVTTAGSADEFKAVYTASPPDLMVIDVVMPEVDGIELVEWLVGSGCSGDVITVTGYNPNYASAAAAIAQAKSSMNVRILQKPVLLADLRVALQAELS